MGTDASLNTPILTRAERAPLIAVSLGVLMVTVMGTTVNVALAQIAADLRFTEASLVWVATAYFASYAAFLLLAGRLSDLFGRRRLFIGGILLFAVASCAGALASSRAMLVGARLLQGLGSAIVLPVALCIVANLCPDSAKRAKALGLYAFVAGGGSTVGALAGGLLVGTLGWRSIFLINAPMGAAVCVLCARFIPRDTDRATASKLDVAGALVLPACCSLLVLATSHSGPVGWGTSWSLVLLAAGAALLVVFIAIEGRASAPILPLELFRNRNLLVANVAGGLTAAAVFSWTYLSTLYLQRVTHLSPMDVSLALGPATLLMASTSLLLAPKCVNRFGRTGSLIAGLLIAAAGLACLALSPLAAGASVGVRIGMLLVGLGIGLAYNPLLLSAVDRVDAKHMGAASGLFNTAYTLSGTLGLTALAQVAGTHSERLLDAGARSTVAFQQGYSLAFYLAAILLTLAVLISGVFARTQPARVPMSQSREAI
jgi:EmrB/QacA subfamily drug resistance transporter